MAHNFDSIFNEIISEDGASVLHKGHARSALRYAQFDLTNIDNPSLAKKIIRKALANVEDTTTKSAEKTAVSFPSLLDMKRPEKEGPRCPRCNGPTPMKNTKLLGNMKARYCPTCRLTEFA